MSTKVKHYPYCCPRCTSRNHIYVVETEHEEDTYAEQWQCDSCGTEWTTFFELEAVRIRGANDD